MKRRPTAADRDIADALYRLEPGRYLVVVDKREAHFGFGLARIKAEGTTGIFLEKTIINLSRVGRCETNVKTAVAQS